jgi:phage terminase small subunit
MRGRPRKPIEEHLLNSTFRADRHGDRAAGAVADGVPTRPSGLNAAERWFWDEVVGGLVALGFAKRIDTATLRAAAEFWSLYRGALAVAKKNPTDQAARSAVVAYHASWQSAASRFGLSPSDRMRIRCLASDPTKARIVPFRDRGPVRNRGA